MANPTCNTCYTTKQPSTFNGIILPDNTTLEEFVGIKANKPEEKNSKYTYKIEADKNVKLFSTEPQYSIINQPGLRGYREVTLSKDKIAKFHVQVDGKFVYNKNKDGSLTLATFTIQGGQVVPKEPPTANTGTATTPPVTPPPTQQAQVQPQPKPVQPSTDPNNPRVTIPPHQQGIAPQQDSSPQGTAGASTGSTFTDVRLPSASSQNTTGTNTGSTPTIIPSNTSTSTTQNVTPITPEVIDQLRMNSRTPYKEVGNRTLESTIQLNRKLSAGDTKALKDLISDTDTTETIKGISDKDFEALISGRKKSIQIDIPIEHKLTEKERQKIISKIGLGLGLFQNRVPTSVTVYVSLEITLSEDKEKLVLKNFVAKDKQKDEHVKSNWDTKDTDRNSEWYGKTGGDRTYAGLKEALLGK